MASWTTPTNPTSGNAIQTTWGQTVVDDLNYLRTMVLLYLYRVAK